MKHTMIPDRNSECNSSSTAGWREALLIRISESFPDKDRAHGLEHALDVEQGTIEAAIAAGYKLESTQHLILSAGALLHDIGRSLKKPSWSSDELEHVTEGALLAKRFLTNLSPFSSEPRIIAKVCYLIYHHDDTNYSFPIATRDGRPGIALLRENSTVWDVLSEEEETEMKPLLSLLREGDARAASGRLGAIRTLDFSLSRRVPPFSNGNPLNDWIWEESSVGNVRLGMKRALIDAASKEGLSLALRQYQQGDEILEDFCMRNGISYEPPPNHYLNSIQRLYDSESDDGAEIVRIQPWSDLIGVLRNVPLRGDRRLFPYAAAAISTRLVGIRNLSPLSAYVVEDRLAFQKQLRDNFLSRYALDLLDLAAILEFRVGDDRALLSPPIIEVYNESAGDKADEIWALVDGTHRLAMALREGISVVRAIVIHGVPAHIPLIALPLKWSDVETVEEVPKKATKRTYRFPSISSCPDISWFSSKQLTERNFKYFFYRDLGELGSAGIR